LPTTKLNPSRDLNISVLGNDGDARVYLTGRLSIDSSPEVRDRVFAMFNQRLLSTLIIDLAGVDYMDSSGIAILVEFFKIARTRNVTLSFTGLRGRPRYLAKATGLLFLFQRNDCADGSSDSKVL
jgi:anti-sigma B factor antagonist